jgi:hypothetical protein
MVVYESSLCATPASRPILSITALTELIKAASKDKQLLLIKGGEAWCPFSRLLDDCVARFASTVQQHEDELADVDALLKRVRFATLELGSTDEGSGRPGLGQWFGGTGVCVGVRFVSLPSGRARFNGDEW